MSASSQTDMAALFETYHDRIYRYVSHLVKNSAEAQDLTQETFLRACRSQESLRDPAAIRGWLYRVATNACLDRLRSSKPTVPLERNDGAEPVDAKLLAPPVAQEIAERKETSACVNRCLDFLPDTYRAVILLYEGHSLTAKEIAQLLGVSVATVKIRLHRARHKLEKVMQQGCCISQNRQGVPTCEPKS
jgi:RNA polymerase sigma-70 factor (ECF subfamily)